jgi:hypothetical protein
VKWRWACSGVLHRTRAKFWCRINPFASGALAMRLALADRILVMRHGRITGELTRAEATEEKIMHLAALGSDNVPVEE